MAGENIKRLLSSVVLIPLVILALLKLPVLYIALLILPLLLIATSEINRILKIDGAVSYIVPPLGLYLIYTYGNGGILPFVFIALFAASLSGVVGATGKEIHEISKETISKAFASLYVTVPLATLILLLRLTDGVYWILFTFIVIWAGDTFAYYAGKSLGSRKLAPSVSPGKTIEGAAGGLLGSVVCGLAFAYYIGLAMAPAMVVLFTVVIGISGIFGDLFESILKRGGNIKDSGHLIPGHGGILDRVDSLLFAIPCLYMLLILTKL